MRNAQLRLAALAIVALSASVWLLSLGRTTRSNETDAPLDWEAFGSKGLNEGEFNEPRGIAVFPDGSFVAVDRMARVQYFASDFTPLKGWAVREELRYGISPKGLSILPNGHLLVCDTHFGQVLEMDLNGNTHRIWGHIGKSPGAFTHPLSCVVDARRNVAYVVEFGAYNDRVQKFDLQGNLLKTWGTFGSEPGEFRRPSGVAVDEEGDVYVADAVNHRIQKFDTEGALLKVFGELGNEPGQLRYPYDIAYFRERLYVAEFNNHRVSVFDREGYFIKHIGKLGEGHMEFKWPWSLTIDPRGYLMVSDTGNYRIQRIRLDDAPQTKTAPNGEP